MGREARLRQAGILKTKYSRWVICNKIDLSYEVATYKDREAEKKGEKTIEKIINVKYMPFLTLGEIERDRLASKTVVPFKTREEAVDYLKEVVNTATVEQQTSLYSLNVVLLEVRNLPTERKLYSQDWATRQVLTEVMVDLKPLKSSKLL